MVNSRKQPVVNQTDKLKGKNSKEMIEILRCVTSSAIFPESNTGTGMGGGDRASKSGHKNVNSFLPLY